MRHIDASHRCQHASAYTYQTQVCGIIHETVLHQRNDLLDSLHAVDIGEHEGPSQTNGLDSQSHKPQGVRAVANAAIGENLDLVENVRVVVVDV